MSHVLTATRVEIEVSAAQLRTDRATRMIAALVGPLFMVSALFVLTNRGAIVAVAQAFAANPSLLVLAGYLTFMPGLIIVVFHNRWHGGLPVLITGIGWLFVVAGLARIMLAWRLAPAMLAALPALLPVMPLVGAAMLALGAALTFAGWRRRSV